MKRNKNILEILKLGLILSVIICILSCDKVIDPDSDLEKIDCDSLKIGIINMDSRIVKSEINKLVTDLKPKVTASDKFGHKENLSILISRLNTQCISIKAELICYACIETNPPQSEILVATDSIGVLIQRVIDILTPSDSNLYCLRIHECY